MLSDIKKFSAELIGTFFMVFIGCSVAAITIDTSVFIFATALAFAVSYFLMIYLLKKFDCHLNPTISLAMFINKKIKLREMGIYMIAQFVGALLGGLSVAIVSLDFGNIGQNVVYAGGGGILAGAFFAELILSFIFVLIYIILRDKEENKNRFGVIICITLFTLYLIGVGLFGGGMNPAKGFAMAILSAGADLTSLTQIWIFLLAPFIGGVAAAYAYLLFNKYLAGKNISINLDFLSKFKKKNKKSEESFVDSVETDISDNFANSDNNGAANNDSESENNRAESVETDNSSEKSIDENAESAEKPNYDIAYTADKKYTLED